MSTYQTPLPIDSVIPQLLAALKTHKSIVLEATPGAGKTTRVPQAIMGAIDGKVFVLEPRRLAAKLAAQRVATELGEEVGMSVGYQVRFEKKEGPQTRLKFLTEGLLLRLFLSDNSLLNLNCIIIDEFHERNIHTDIALGLSLLIQKHLNPQLKIIVMSATMNSQMLLDYLPESHLIRAEGKVFPTEISYLPNKLENSFEHLHTWQPFQGGRPNRSRIDEHVEDALEKLLQDPECRGHILIFFAGTAEILRAADQLRYLCQKYDCVLLELRSETPSAQQSLVFKESAKRKIILSTNVAETSVTIDGVTAVIDIGTAKISSHANWNGFGKLELKKISQASAIQRAGRAGRTAPGKVIRLYTKGDFENRAAHEKPEIQRVDLTQTWLELNMALEKLAQIIGKNSENPFLKILFPFIEEPSLTAKDHAISMLTLLGALDANAATTAIGKAMAQLPVHPRLSRVMVAAEGKPCAALAALCVALISEAGVLKRNRLSQNWDEGHSDLFFQAKQVLANQVHGNIDASAIKRVQQLWQQLCTTLGIKKEIPKLESYFDGSDDELEYCLLLGFCDRVAAQVGALTSNTSTGAASFKNTNSANLFSPGQGTTPLKANKNSENILALCMGGQAHLSANSCAHLANYLIAFDAEIVKTGNKGQSQVQVNLASEVSPSTLQKIDSFIKLKQETLWDPNSQRAKSFERMYYGQLVLAERQISLKNAEEMLLFEKLKTDWPKPFTPHDLDIFEGYKARKILAAQLGLNLNLPEFENPLDFDLLLSQIAENKRSYAEILEHSLWDYIKDSFSFAEQQTLEEFLPRKIKIGAGRLVQVNYQHDKPPWIGSRIQDFFGTRSTPKIAGGKISLVVHLLAPNGQAVQVTNDLEGFWHRYYPEVKKELSRKYPRHFWPEDPSKAEPPPPRHSKNQRH